MNVPPDFAYKDSKSGPNLIYIHRTLGNSEAYFVANTKEHAVEGVCSFRVQGKRSELWWPETGRTELVAAYEERDGVTNVPIHLESTESIFVVFRDDDKSFDPVASVLLDGQPV